MIEITSLNMILGIICIAFVFLIPTNLQIEERMKMYDSIEEKDDKKEN